MADATGGTITYSGGRTIHTFTSSGNFVVPNYIEGTPTVDYLLVAGGGGGGNNEGGGGGGGGLLTATDYAVTAQTYGIVIGGGGATHTVGGNTTFDGLTAAGGGRGGTRGPEAGGNGGCGGGGSGTAVGTSAAGTGSQGYNGGLGVVSRGGGGGGMGAAGAFSVVDGTGGVGGDGLANSLSGASVTYAGGGGGGDYTAGGAGGTGGGGAGAAHDTSGTAGTDGLGGGGGGAGSTTGTGGAGGSGVVIISYTTDQFIVSVTTEVPAGSITITGYAPTHSPLNIDVPLGTIDITGYAPAYAPEKNITIPLGTIDIAGYAPYIGDEVLHVRTADGTLIGSIADGDGSLFFSSGSEWYAMKFVSSAVEPNTFVGHGATGATETINWALGDVHTCILDDNCTFTFTAPTKGKHLTLIMVGNGTAYTPVWPATVKWVTIVPTWSGVSGAKNIVSMIWDGATYIASGGDAK